MKNDHELIHSFQKGSRSAFDELVRRHLDSVHRFFLRITGNPMEAEDLAQDVFLKCYKSLKTFKFQADFTTYLYRININTGNTWIRRNRWKHFLHLDQAPEPIEEDQSMEKEWSRKELWYSIAALPKQQRMVVMMRIAQELPYQDIANLLGTTVGSAKVSYHHGIRQLKQKLEKTK
ncbi:MAG: RNA polymerase sigma factor [Candidatus Marinimicrobia bacterium]|nr:RNA polymerase sigma factor [Candidatus Neomarinimicrobiota bacterium]